MVLEIITKINCDLLDFEIKRIGKEHICYLVMNSRTALELASNGKTVAYMAGKDSSYRKYFDIPIAIFDGLNYGEVELVKAI